MNPAILAYTQLPGQLPAAGAAQLRAAVPYGRRMHLAPEGAPAIASLLGMALARALLAEVRGQTHAEIKLHFPRGKKPFSAGGGHFSVSHSGGWLAVLVCASSRVGLDIEVATPVNSQGRTPHRNLSDWTAREAMVKLCDATLAQISEVQVHESYCQFRQQHGCLMRPQAPEPLVAAVLSEQPLLLTVRYLSWESLLVAEEVADAEVACA